ncbi:MAG: oligosaccharide flippase family protein [Actinomycetota bacterium]
MTAPADTRPVQGFSRFVRDSAMYSIGTVVGKAAALLILPIVTRSLGPRQYGELEVLSTLMSACTSILILGLDVAVTRTYPLLDESARRRMFASWMAMGGLLTVPFALGLALARAPISDWLFAYQNMAEEVALAGMFVVVTTGQLIALTVLRNQGRAGRFALITGGALMINAVLVVVFLQREEAVRSVLLANVISQGIAAVAGLWMTRRAIVAVPSIRASRDLLRLGLPLVPASIALLFGEVLHRTILFAQSSDVEVGFFGIAVRFASITVLVVMGFQTAWQPRAFAAFEEPDGLRSIAIDARRILAVVCLSAVAGAVLAPDAVRLVGGDAFAGATSAVGWMMIWALAFGGYQIVTMPSAIDQRMGDIGLSGAFGTLIALAINQSISADYGAAGTAAAMTVGQVLAIALALGLSRRRVVIPFANAPMLVVSASAVAVILVSTVGAAGVTVRAIGFLGFGAVLVIDGSLIGARQLLAGRRG